MDRLSTGGRQASVEHLLVEGVVEAELRGHGTVGPLGEVSLDQQPGVPRQSRTKVGDLLRPEVRPLLAGPGQHGRRRELHAHGGGDLEQLTIGRGQLVELLFDELTDAVGDPETVEPLLAARLAADLGQQSAVDQVVDHGRHEQGVAVGVLVDVVDQRL